MEFIVCRWVLNTGMLPASQLWSEDQTTAVDPNVLEISVTLKRILGSASRSQTSRQSWPLAMWDLLDDLLACADLHCWTFWSSGGW